MSAKALFRKLFDWLPGPPSSVYVYRKLEPNLWDLTPPNPVVYDIGGGDAKARYSYGPPPSGARVVSVDVEAEPGVDIVADAQDMSVIPDGSADCVTSVGMLIHCERPEKAVAEMIRILKPGGIFYLSVPFIYTACLPHVDYVHWTSPGVRTLCGDLEEIDCGHDRGPGSTMAQLAREFGATVFSFNTSAGYVAGSYVFGWLTFWLKYLDIVIGGWRHSQTFYTATYFLGRKRA